MSLKLSPVVSTLPRGDGARFAVKSIDLTEFGEHASPLVVLDDFRVRGQPFGPHPHAGFSAVTYVFEDSRAALRSRDSLGNDIIMGPGGMVWTQAGSGVIHEELPAEPDSELHGLQFFVNLSSRNKLNAPRVLRVDPSAVPQWKSITGDRVRAVVGSYEGHSSPLVPAEPFNMLDVELHRQIFFSHQSGHNTILYVRTGSVIVRAECHERRIGAEQGMALYGGSGQVSLEASQPAQLLILSGAAIHERVLVEGPFIMSDRSQLDAAIARHRAGAMGHLERAAGPRRR